MNRSDLIRLISRKTEVSQAEIEKILDLTIDLIEEALACGESVVIKNFGKFETRERAATVRKNPRSGEEIKVPKKKGVLFHPAPAFKTNVQEENINECNG